MAALEIPFSIAVVFLSLVSSGAHAQVYSFRADSAPLPYYYREGGNVRMSCFHNSSLQFQYWIHPTEGNISVSRGRVTLEKKYGDVTLTLSNARKADNGSYICVCSFGAVILTSNAISANLRLPITVHASNSSITLGVGESHKFSCNASNIVQLQWVHISDQTVLSTVLANTSDGKIEITRSHDLQLRHVQLKDSGFYECLLKNDLMNIRLHHTLKVVAFPFVSVQNSNHEVMEGQSASLVCTVSGNPLPDVTWKDRLGAVLQNTEGVTITTAVHNSTYVTSVLNFAVVQGSKVGPYTCTAVNMYGHVALATTYLQLEGTTSTNFFRTTSSTRIGIHIPYYFYIVMGIGTLFCFLIIISIIAIHFSVKISMKKYRPQSGKPNHEMGCSSTPERAGSIQFSATTSPVCP